MAISINGEFISDDQIKIETERMQRYYYQYMQAKGSEGNVEELTKWAVENLVEQTLLKQQAAGSIEPPPAEMVEQNYQQAKAQLADLPEEKAKIEIAAHMMVERLIHDVTKDVTPPTEEEIAEFYEKNLEGFKMPEQVHASHIIKNTKTPEDVESAEKAINEIKVMLDDGAAFDEIAKSHSDCPDAAGDLGTFPRGRMVPEFENVIFDLEPGETSAVFKTQFGFHIAKLHEKRPAGTASLHEVTEFIGQEITRSRSQGILEKYVDELKKTAEINRDAKA